MYCPENCQVGTQPTLGHGECEQGNRVCLRPFFFFLETYVIICNYGTWASDDLLDRSVFKVWRSSRIRLGLFQGRLLSKQIRFSSTTSGCISNRDLPSIFNETVV